MRILRNILSRLNYKKLQENVKIAQKELSIGNLIKELESFYEKVAERKTKYG